MAELAITYVWGFQGENALQYHTANGCVFRVHWNLDGSANDGANSASAIGVLDLLPPEEEDMIPLTSLTEETVVEWIKAGLGDELVAGYLGQIRRTIEEQVNPTEASGLPWKNEPEVEETEEAA